MLIRKHEKVKMKLKQNLKNHSLKVKTKHENKDTEEKVDKMEKCDKYATTREYEEIIQSKRYHVGSTSKGLKKKRNS